MTYVTLTKKFFATRKEANKYLKKLRERCYCSTDTFNVYDLKKSHPKRIKTRFLVGSYFDWLDV